MVSKCLSRELQPFNISVISMHPGWVCSLNLIKIFIDLNFIDLNFLKLNFIDLNFIDLNFINLNFN